MTGILRVPQETVGGLDEEKAKMIETKRRDKSVLTRGIPIRKEQKVAGQFALESTCCQRPEPCDQLDPCLEVDDNA
jgi:hypothetical protein